MANSNQVNSPNSFILMFLKLHQLKRIILPFVLASMFVCLATTVFAQEDDDDVEFTQGVESTKANDSSDDPVELFYKAQEAHSKGELQTALKLYEQAIVANPEFPEAEFQRGTIFQTLGKIDDAEKAFRRAIELRRDWTLPISELGGLLIVKGEYVEAEKLLDQAIRIDPMSFPAYVALTELQLKTNASDESLKTLLAKLQYLTKKAKIPASIWSARAAIERKLNEKDAAKMSLQRALEIDGNNQFALEETIEISLLEGDSKGAVETARSLSKSRPNSINAKLLLAKSLHMDGNSEEAIQVLDSIDNPRQDVKQLRSAIILQGNDNIETLEEILKKDEKNVSILGRLCILSRVEQPQKALEYCKTASELEPTNVNHAVGFGAALVQLKRYTDAVNLFRRILAISPENYTARANLATALFQLNRFEEAKKEYLWITLKQPDIAVAYYFLAISHDKLGEYLDAMANYQQFLKLAGESQKLEVQKVNLRLPSLQKQIKRGKGKR